MTPTTTVIVAMTDVRALRNRSPPRMYAWFDPMFSSFDRFPGRFVWRVDRLFAAESRVDLLTLLALECVQGRMCRTTAQDAPNTGVKEKRRRTDIGIVGPDRRPEVTDLQDRRDQELIVR